MKAFTLLVFSCLIYSSDAQCNPASVTVDSMTNCTEAYVGAKASPGDVIAAIALGSNYTPICSKMVSVSGDVGASILTCVMGVADAAGCDQAVKNIIKTSLATIERLFSALGDLCHAGCGDFGTLPTEGQKCVTSLSGITLPEAGVTMSSIPTTSQCDIAKAGKECIEAAFRTCKPAWRLVEMISLGDPTESKELRADSYFKSCPDLGPLQFESKGENLKLSILAGFAPIIISVLLNSTA